MIVRRCQPTDSDEVRHLFSTVYSETMFDALQTDEARIPAMSFVTLGPEQQVIGYVAATRAELDSAPVLALVPPAVDEDHRGRGVGQALMHTVLGAAESRDEPLVGLVATPPEWLSQFDFHPGEELSIDPAVRGWKPYFRVRRLSAYDPSLTGTFVFPASFGA